MIPIYVATEDVLSEVVADRLVEETEGVLQTQVRVGGHGFGYLYRKRRELYTLSAHIPVLLLTDLDQKECAPSLVDEWFPKYDKPLGFLFRVVVREIEAWLLADKKGFSSFFRVPLGQIPSEPELLNDPKQSLIQLVKRYSPRRIQQDIVPDGRISARVGFGYNDRLAQFVKESWHPEQAALLSDSLARTRHRLAELCRMVKAEQEHR